MKCVFGQKEFCLEQADVIYAGHSYCLTHAEEVDRAYKGILKDQQERIHNA